ncbi:ACP phosphodiesterase [Ningiella sp. W23]|uniref:acyl carrier protein phosphodiesterase n=1 Tax=Ningiella sp. W23 TaxID=3023715 RepID=UPI003757039F
MNYLSHIQLAHISNTSLVGNFLGDFVKGSDLSHLPKPIQTGIKLHRSIDSFTDSHDSVVKLRQQFPNNLRRISGVIIDVYFDHLLTQHHEHFTDLSLEQVLDRFYRELEDDNLDISERFNLVRNSLIKHRWLENYSQLQACLKAFLQIEQRLGGRITFANEGLAFIQKNAPLFEDAFLSLYPSLTKHVLQRVAAFKHQNQ